MILVLAKEQIIELYSSMLFYEKDCSLDSSLECEPNFRDKR